MGLMQSLLRKDRHASGVASPKPGKPEAPETASLIILVPDAQGIATYQLHDFRSARAAEIFVDVTLRGQVGERTVVFWALTWQPTADYYAEPLVLIRDLDSTVVYLFSFADLGSCHDFIRHEMTRGLELSQVMIYWAVPAAVKMDFWGRAAVSPASAPMRPYTADSRPVVHTEPEPPTSEPEAQAEAEADSSLLPFVAREEPPQSKRYLTEADIADTMREMQEFTSRFDAERPPVIDFPSASRKIRRSKKAMRAAAGWHNFSLALDESLDVYVSQQVRIRIALNRITRALAQAAFIQATTAPKTEEEPVPEASKDVSPVWAYATIALADAAAVAIRRALMRKVWMNTAWTMEEAVYAHRLETRSRVVRGWRFAAAALLEAADARNARDSAIISAWSALTTEFGHAAETQVATEGARLAWGNFAIAIKEATRTHARKRKIAVTTWSRLARAFKQAVAAEEKQRKTQEKAEHAAARAAARAAAAARKEFERAEKLAAKEAARAAALAEKAAAKEAKRMAAAAKRAEAIAAKLNARAAEHVEHEAEERAAEAEALRLAEDADAQVIVEEVVSEEAPSSDEEEIAKWLEKQGVTDEEPAVATEAPAKKKSRWEPHEEPFEGFRSPPGRF